MKKIGKFVRPGRNSTRTVANPHCLLSESANLAALKEIPVTLRGGETLPKGCLSFGYQKPITKPIRRWEKFDVCFLFVRNSRRFVTNSNLKRITAYTLSAICEKIHFIEIFLLFIHSLDVIFMISEDR